MTGDAMSDTLTTTSMSTWMRLTAVNSVNVANGDGQTQLPYHVMLDDYTNVDRTSYCDIVGPVDYNHRYRIGLLFQYSVLKKLSVDVRGNLVSGTPSVEVSTLCPLS